jgi:hypothetical protein
MARTGATGMRKAKIIVNATTGIKQHKIMIHAWRAFALWVSCVGFNRTSRFYYKMCP